MSTVGYECHSYDDLFYISEFVHSKKKNRDGRRFRNCAPELYIVILLSTFLVLFALFLRRLAVVENNVSIELMTFRIEFSIEFIFSKQRRFNIDLTYDIYKYKTWFQYNQNRVVFIQTSSNHEVIGCNVVHILSPDLYWIPVEEAENRPAVEVRSNRVARARFANVTVGGRELSGAFWGSLDGETYKSSSYEVSINPRTKVILLRFWFNFHWSETLSSGWGPSQ